MLRRYIKPWPWHSCKRYKSSFRQTFRLALDAFTNHELASPVERPQQFIVPPNLLSRLRAQDSGGQFVELIDRKLISVSDSLRLYQNLRGSLDERAVLALCISLYKDSRFDILCTVLIENLSLGGDLSAAFQQLYSVLCRQDEKDFVIGNLVQGFLHINQKSLAHFLFQDLGLDPKELDPVIQQVRLIQDLHAYCDNERSAYLMVRDCLGRHFPQLMAHGDLSLWTRFHIWKFMLKYNPRYLDLIFNKFHENFMGKKFVLTNFLKSAVAQNQSNLVHFVSYRLKKGGKLFYDEDLQFVPSIAYDGKSLAELWNSFRIYHAALRKDDLSFSTQCDKPSQSIHYKLLQGSITNDIDTIKERKQSEEPTTDSDRSVARFLARAVALDQSITCSSIVKYGNGQFDSHLLSKALMTVIFGRKKLPYDDTDSLFRNPGTIDTSLLVRTINSVPPDQVAFPLFLCMRRLNTKFSFEKCQSVDGHLLWNISLALEQSNLPRLPQLVETQLAQALSCRSHIEQLRFMALTKVSVSGIVALLGQYIRNLHDAGFPEDFGTNDEADIRLILAGLLLIEEKAGPSTNKDIYFSQIIGDLFEKWNREKAFELMQMLQEQNIEPSGDALVRIEARLLDKERYHVASELLSRVRIPDPKTYFMFLATTCTANPKLCMPIVRKLEELKKPRIPTSLYVKMAIGFSQSLKLSDALSKKYTMWMIKRIRQRHERLGPRLAEALVDSLLDRAERTQWGSRKRLQWALDVAKSEGVSKDIVDRWMERLHTMRTMQTGYWAKGRYRYDRAFSGL